MTPIYFSWGWQSTLVANRAHQNQDCWVLYDLLGKHHSLKENAYRRRASIMRLLSVFIVEITHIESLQSWKHAFVYFHNSSYVHDLQHSISWRLETARNCCTWKKVWIVLLFFKQTKSSWAQSFAWMHRRMLSSRVKACRLRCHLKEYLN